MEIKKALLAVIASLAIVVTMIPLGTLTVSADTTYDYSLCYDSSTGKMHENTTGGEEVDLADVPGWESKKTGDSYTLVLKGGFNFKTSTEIGLICPKGATIEVKGENSIQSSYNPSNKYYCAGISLPGEEENHDLTFKGDGNLTVSSNEENNTNVEESYGISNNEGITSFEGTGTITLKAGDATNNSIGLGAGYKTKVLSGKIVAKSGKAYKSFGMKGSGGLTVSGGEIETTSEDADYTSIGLYEDNNIDVSGGKLTATGGTAYDNSFGINAKGSITVSGGKVTAKSEEAAVSYGLYQSTEDDIIAISGGEIEAIGNGADSRSIGLFTYNDITVSGGKLTATGGDCTIPDIEISASTQAIDPNTMSLGIYSLGAKVTSGGNIIATGGPAGTSYGIYTMMFNLENGTVKAIGSEKASQISVGIFGIDSIIKSVASNETSSNININYNGLIAQGNTMALYSGADDMEKNKGVYIKDGIDTVGSTNYDGSDPVVYAMDDIDSYKYVKTITKEKSPTPDKDKGTNPDKGASPNGGGANSQTDTGDSMNLAIPIGIAIAALIAIAAIIIAGKRKK